MTDAALSRLEGVCARLEALEARLGKGGSGGSGAPAPSAVGGVQEEAPFVKAFDDLTSEFFAPLEIGAKACGPDVVTHTQRVWWLSELCSSSRWLRFIFFASCFEPPC